MACGIYLIKNKINGKCYVGQSIDIETRWRRHRTDATKVDSPLYRAVRKYKIENFDFSVLEECDAEKLNERELSYMYKLKTFLPDGYNIDLPNSRPAIIPDYVIEAIEMLKSSTYTTDEIGDLLGVSGVMIRAINRGASWRQDDYSYPIRPTKNTDTCITCGALRPRGNAKYCSKKCIRNEASRKVPNRPDLNTLSREIYLLGYVGTGKKYGVSDNAIRKWCDAYNIPRRKVDFIKWYEKIFAPVV